MRLAIVSFIVGSCAFVLIGLLHTYVHFTYLAGPDLFARFEVLGTTALGGMQAPVWGLFQGTSILMGYFSLALGLVLLAYVWGLSQGALPQRSICAVVIGLLVSIMIVGNAHLSALQVYGGAFGIVCFGLPILASFRKTSAV